MAAEPITCKAMVAFGVDDLREEEIIVAPPKAAAFIVFFAMSLISACSS